MATHNLSCEPMDIDLSSQSVKDMDISYNDSVDNTHSITRSRRFSESESNSRISISPINNELSRRKRTPSKLPVVNNFHIIVKKPSRNYRSTFLKIITVVFITFISIITYQMYNLNCCDQLSIENLSETLSDKLYGQPVAMKNLVNILEIKAKSKLLFFSGGTGVGKTYTSSLLLDTIGSCSNIYHYTMPTFETIFSTDLMLGLTVCKMSIIIVDDLTINDMNVKTHIKNVIEKSENLEKEIIVILIYNCNQIHQSFTKRCDESFKKKLLDNFSDVNALKSFIQFEPLSENHLKQCIQQELGSRKLSDIEFHNVLKNFNVSADGCKGVYSKMKYLNIV